jgi:hypothetical protein
MKIRACLFGSILLAAAQPASAAFHIWDWHRGDPGTAGLNDTGGIFRSIYATFDTATNHLTWDMTFADQVTRGFTLALNNGPNPKGHAGELALLYADYRDAANIRITAYGYNGQNSMTSWQDGNGEVAGNQAPDLIKGTLDRASWVIAASKTNNPDGSRTLAMTLDVTDLINHTPLHPDPNGDPWYGIGFAEKLGLWLHPFRTFTPTYGPGGQITALTTDKQGWFDGSNFMTVPTPATAAFLSLTALTTLRRRRA